MFFFGFSINIGIMNLFHNKLRPGDFLIIFLIVLLAIISFGGNFGKKSGFVKIQTEKDSFVYDLSKNSIYTFDGPLGKTQIEIKDKKVRIIDSPCPNRTCVAQKWGTVLVCLPNKIFVTVEDFQGEFDAIAE